MCSLCLRLFQQLIYLFNAELRHRSCSRLSGGLLLFLRLCCRCRLRHTEIR